jgi:DNA-binding LacI/PurR family transcriptional regulator
MATIKEFTKQKGGYAGLKWHAVKKFVMSEVAAGKYSQGDALPSENYLCEYVGVSRNTIRQAFDELEKEGYVSRIRGKGTFLAKVVGGKTTKKTQMYGVVLPEINRSLYPSLVQGFDHAVSEKNYQTMICQSDNDVSKQGNIILQLLYRGIDGLAIVPPVTTTPTPVFQIKQLIDAKIPVVACHRSIDGVSIPTLTWNREEVGRMAGLLLLENGHRRIVYYGVSRYSVTEAHVKGLKAVLAGAGVLLSDDMIIYEPSSEMEDNENRKFQKLTTLLKSPNRPTAVFCNDDNEAEKIFWLANNLGLKVPNDLSIIGFGNSHRDTFFRKTLTSIIINEYALGTRAAGILHEINSGRRTIEDNQVYMMDLDIYSGTTVGKPNC